MKSSFFGGMALMLCLPAFAGYTFSYTGNTTSGQDLEWLWKNEWHLTKWGYYEVYRYAAHAAGCENDYSGSNAHASVYNEVHSWTTGAFSGQIQASGSYKWSHDGQDQTALYNFYSSVQAWASADASLEVGSEDFGSGKLQASAYTYVKWDTSSADSDEDKIYVTAGVEYKADQGGYTGFGISAAGFSISWRDPVTGYLDPSESQAQPVHAGGTDDDPGTLCYVEISTLAKVEGGSFADTERYTNEAGAYANFDLTYANWRLTAPTLR